MKKTMQILLAVLMTTFVFSVQAETTVPETIKGTKNVSAEELIELVGDDPDLVLIDSRKPSDYVVGHIEGSVSLPDTDTTPKTLASHILNKSTPIIFYCNGIKCHRSANAAKIAVTAGYTKIYWFRGGWAEWTEKGYPVAR